VAGCGSDVSSLALSACGGGGSDPDTAAKPSAPASSVSANGDAATKLNGATTTELANGTSSGASTGSSSGSANQNGGSGGAASTVTNVAANGSGSMLAGVVATGGSTSTGGTTTAGGTTAAGGSITTGGTAGVGGTTTATTAGATSAGGTTTTGGKPTTGGTNTTSSTTTTGSTGTTTTGSTNTTTPTTGTTTPTPADSNTVPVVVKNSAGEYANFPQVSVTLCTPGATGSTQCVTIDKMLLDTGSYGVRVVASALGSALTQGLPAQTGAVGDSTSAAPIAECTLFASGYTWGAVKRADVIIGEKKAANLPIQVMGDGGFAEPSDCSSRGGQDLSSVAALGANGILGLGPLPQDYPSAAKQVLPATYYMCPTSSECVNASVPLGKQVANPVSAFATDNNGIVVQLPAVDANGSSTVTGQLIFGVGTRANNALASGANIAPLSDNGRLTTTYGMTRYVNSFVDTGSNGIFFPDSTIAQYSSWYTPGTPLALNASISSTGSTTIPVSVSVGNALTLFSSGNAAFSNVAAYSSGVFAWGLPFFYGRSVFIVMKGSTANAQPGPFIAF
jgi:hypothetical protein